MEFQYEHSEFEEPVDQYEECAKELSSAFGCRVRNKRKQAKLTKKLFALMVGIGRPFLDKIENGTADVRLSVVVRIAKALETTPSQLLADPDEECEPTDTKWW